MQTRGVRSEERSPNTRYQVWSGSLAAGQLNDARPSQEPEREVAITLIWLVLN